MHVQPEVQQAVEAGQPVVALESTIVAHGMPFPENLELARQVESILRNKVHDSFPLGRKSWHQDERQFLLDISARCNVTHDFSPLFYL